MIYNFLKLFFYIIFIQFEFEFEYRLHIYLIAIFGSLTGGHLSGMTPWVLWLWL